MFGHTKHTTNSRIDSANLERKKTQRLRFMIELYDMVDGFDAQAVETTRLAARLGFNTTRPQDLLEVLKVVHYLQGEGLLVASGPTSEATNLTLTHKGVREVEEARSEPDRPTEHFSPLSTIRSRLPEDSPSEPDDAAARTLSVLAEPNRLEVLRVTQSLQEWTDQLSLDEEQRAEYGADIRTIEAQLDSPRPKTRLIGIALQSIRSTAEKANGTPGSAGSIISL